MYLLMSILIYCSREVDPGGAAQPDQPEQPVTDCPAFKVQQLVTFVASLEYHFINRKGLLSEANMLSQNPCIAKSLNKLFRLE